MDQIIFLLLSFLCKVIVTVKNRLGRDSNLVFLMLEVTALPTELQPLLGYLNIDKGLPREFVP